LLLDELLAERDRVVEPLPEPTLTVEPVAVPPQTEVGRKQARQRMAELEDAARRTYRSAEEARRVLHQEHMRLEQEATARNAAQQESQALRREVDRLREAEERRAASEKTRAERAARAEIAKEIKRFHEEHERVVEELNSARGALHDHDGLLEEYAMRLREEQNARALLRGELDRAEAARALAERSLESALDNSRRRNEDDSIRVATAEQRVADLESDNARLQSRLDELIAGDGAIGKLEAEIAERDAQIAELDAQIATMNVRIADLSARSEASEDAAQGAIAERDAAEAERVAEAEERAREAEKMQGRLRREASDAAKAQRALQETLATVVAEREDLQRRVSGLDEEIVRARAESDRLREHAAALGDELAAVRASVAELQAAAPAHDHGSNASPSVAPLHPHGPVVEVVDRDPEPTTPEPPASETIIAAEAPVGAVDVEPPAPSATEDPAPPPLPLRIAGRHAPPPEPEPLVRRKPPVVEEPEAPVEKPVEEVKFHVPAFVAAAVEDEAAEEPQAKRAEPGNRRTAMAELTALASAGDDFSYRRR
jgi:chromosome segregation ATPase